MYVRKYFLCINLGVEMLEYNVSSSSALVDIANLLSEAVVSKNIYINNMQGFLILYILANVVLPYGWGFTFLLSVKCWTSFHMFFSNFSSLHLLFISFTYFYWFFIFLMRIKVLCIYSRYWYFIFYICINNTFKSLACHFPSCMEFIHLVSQQKFKDLTVEW